MADEIDVANDYAQKNLDFALGLAKLKAAPEYHPDFDGETCVECGEELPPERLALGRVRCVACQSKQEVKRGNFR